MFYGPPDTPRSPHTIPFLTLLPNPESSHLPHTCQGVLKPWPLIQAIRQPWSPSFCPRDTKLFSASPFACFLLSPAPPSQQRDGRDTGWRDGHPGCRLGCPVTWAGTVCSSQLIEAACRHSPQIHSLWRVRCFLNRKPLSLNSNRFVTCTVLCTYQNQKTLVGRMSKCFKPDVTVH